MRVGNFWRSHRWSSGVGSFLRLVTGITGCSARGHVGSGIEMLAESSKVVDVRIAQNANPAGRLLYSVAY